MSIRRRPSRLAQIEAAPLSALQLKDLWAAYQANRADSQLRNRLVMHYLPWVQGKAASIAKRMKLLDQENAVGEVLAALVASIVPGYDGKSSFERWARICVRQKLVSQRRLERTKESHIDDRAALPDVPMGCGESPLCGEQGNDLLFLQITSELTDLQAAVLWLRFQRGISVEAIAEILKTPPGAVKGLTFRAVRDLRKKFAARNQNDCVAY